MTTKYTKEQLVDAVKSSHSIRSPMLKLGLVAAGSAYKSFHKSLKLHNIDISHFTGQSWAKNKITGPKQPLSYYLTLDSTITSHKLRQRLIKENIFKYKCYNCNLQTWLGNPIPLELEHINGNHTDNRLENLTLLCPNCHALTPTYCKKKSAQDRI